MHMNTEVQVTYLIQIICEYALNSDSVNIKL